MTEPDADVVIGGGVDDDRLTGGAEFKVEAAGGWYTV